MKMSLLKRVVITCVVGVGLMFNQTTYAAKKTTHSSSTAAEQQVTQWTTLQKVRVATALSRLLVVIARTAQLSDSQYALPLDAATHALRALNDGLFLADKKLETIEGAYYGIGWIAYDIVHCLKSLQKYVAQEDDVMSGIDGSAIKQNNDIDQVLQSLYVVVLPLVETAITTARDLQPSNSADNKKNLLRLQTLNSLVRLLQEVLGTNSKSIEFKAGLGLCLVHVVVSAVDLLRPIEEETVVFLSNRRLAAQKAIIKMKGMR
jgi:hypothetical protein